MTTIRRNRVSDRPASKTGSTTPRTPGPHDSRAGDADPVRLALINLAAGEVTVAGADVTAVSDSGAAV